MKIQIIASTFIDGAPKDPGDIVDVADGVGRELIGLNRAVPCVDSSPAVAPAPDAPAAEQPAAPANS